MTGPPVDPQALVLATSELYGHGIYLGSSLTARDTPVFARVRRTVCSCWDHHVRARRRPSWFRMFSRLAAR